MIGNIDMSIKIVLVGDSGTGKSSLLNVYIKNGFPENYS
jgi:GTPase SAR1 family protein